MLSGVDAILKIKAEATTSLVKSQRGGPVTLIAELLDRLWQGGSWLVLGNTQYGDFSKHFPTLSDELVATLDASIDLGNKIG